jgi:hypothetical protein
MLPDSVTIEVPPSRRSYRLTFLRRASSYSEESCVKDTLRNVLGTLKTSSCKSRFLECLAVKCVFECCWGKLKLWLFS